MSVQALSWAFKVCTGHATLKSVLVALANYADENGVCWPSQARIARDTELTDRTVRDALTKLEAEGIITRTRRADDDGYRTSDLIQLNHAYRKEVPVGSSGLPAGDAGNEGLPENASGRPTGKSLHKNGSHFPGNRKGTVNLSSLRSERAARKTRLTEDFTLTKERIAKGVAKGLTEQETINEFGKFQDHYIGNGTAWVCWDRCWSKWLSTATERSPRKAALASGRSAPVTEFRIFERMHAHLQDGRREDGRDEVALPF